MAKIRAIGLLLAAVCACGGSGTSPASPSAAVGPAAPDAGSSSSGGAQPDAGAAPDAGSLPDAGSPSDAGPADAGLPLDGGSADAGPGATGDSPDAGPAAIDADRELAIVDPSVVLDPRASNQADGAWSFRWLVEQFAGARAPQLVEVWLRSLRTASVDGAPVGDRSGVEDLLSAWPRAQDGSLDLSRAPFQLLAIFNRLDLAGSGKGEGRFVFGLVDPATGQPGRMTVALEYRLPSTSSRQEWAQRWHALAGHGFGAQYAAALESLTRAFTAAGVDSAGVNGSALSQLRTNEAQFGPGWEQRQWVLDRDASGAALRPVLTPGTPMQSLNDTAQLAQWLRDNAAVVRTGHFDLPRALTGGAARETEAWSFRNQAGVDEPLRHAFAAQTCNGCHSSETDAARGFFHVDPFMPPGRGRLSGFLRDSQLPQRAQNLASLLAGGPPVATHLPALPQPVVQYDLSLVPSGDDTAPVALDARGRVLGNSPRGPWIWDGALHPIGTSALHATGFNPSGDVVGYTGKGSGRSAFVLRHGVVSFPGTLGGAMSLGNAIDPLARVAGDSLTGSGDYHGFLFANGSLSDLGTLGGSETMTAAINAQGQITGESQASDGSRHAFISGPGGLRDLGTLGGGFALGQAINDKGQVAGMSEMVPGDRKIHAFFHDGAVMHDLGALPGLPWTSAPGLNNAGVVVGNVYNKPDDGSSNYDTYPYVWRDGVMANLNERVPPSGVKLRTVLGINDAGQILCSDGQVGAGTAHAYLLVPR